MTKTIDTLVPDILELFGDEDRTALSPERMADFVTALTAKVTNRLGETRRGNSNLRVSNLGTPCERKLWYSVNASEKAEPLPPEAKVKFLFGDLLEEMLLYLAREAGHTVEREQEEVTINGVVGHIDAVIDGVLVDCKSASSFSFTKFSNGLTSEVDDFGYLTQLDTYMAATGISSGAFLVIDKQLGKICLDRHARSGVQYDEIIDRKREMLSEKEPPARGYRPVADGASGNEKLGVACSYCAFKDTCWPELRTFLYASGPRFLTTVRRTPNVPEVE